ncbi:hypothetical protein PJIAN_321 [Paludibacter jiangxiensis]|uniref:Uncharacterized protein n=1 Tax=Paludibacter jiangxiensis TaxID=681398 RepID=A0A170ZJ24_9BACT|nr:hypothetical protein PJIAN_321 [Paludibacter jiangxiensis]
MQMYVFQMEKLSPKHLEKLKQITNCTGYQSNNSISTGNDLISPISAKWIR